MKILALIPLLVTSSFAMASGKIDYLNIDGDVVHFSTDEAKVAVSPACVVAATAENWTVSLNSDSGRAMYSLLITAMAGNLGLDVVSAQDCNDAVGVERAKAVTITPEVNSNSTGTGSFQLYMGDGITPLGPIVGIEKAIDIYYLSPGDDTNLQWYRRPVFNRDLYFTQNDCEGPGYLQYHNYVNVSPIYNGGRFFISASTQTIVTRKSILSPDGTCTNTSHNYVFLYELDNSYAHPQCGIKPCVIKQN